MAHENTHFQNLFSLLSAAATSYNNQDHVPCACQLRSLAAIAQKFATEINPPLAPASPLRNCPIVNITGRFLNCGRGKSPKT